MSQKLMMAAAMSLALATAAQAQNSWEGDKPIFDIEQQYIRFPLPASESRYAPINGDHIKTYVDEITAISRASEKAGDQLWGRIAGTRYDQMTQDWFAAKLRALNISVQVDPIPLGVQNTPVSWEVSFAGAGGKRVLTSAVPLLRTTYAAKTDGVDLDMVWVGLGAAADFAGRDVKGKAAVIYSSPITGGFQTSASLMGSVRRAMLAGARAVIVVLAIPGNAKGAMYGGGDMPTFTVGMADGDALQKAIESGAPPKLHVALKLERQDLKSANVLGVLPGTTDENIILIAHTDGFYEAANDNASGLATTVALAEYYAKIPQAQRRRNIIFMATAAHHAVPPSPGTMFMHKTWGDKFAKTALLINVEHTSETQVYFWARPPLVRKSTGMNARIWNVNASPTVETLIGQAFKTFGYAVYDTPQVQPSGDINSIAFDAPSFGISDLPQVYHTDLDRAEFIPAAGLEGGGRVIATVIDGVNRLTLDQVVRKTPHPGNPAAK